MDFSRYDFSCQKAFHKGLQYARSLGHPTLEVEHVALALVRGGLVSLKSNEAQKAKQDLESYLSSLPKVFGPLHTQFGKRLDTALDIAEQNSAGGKVGVSNLWLCLVKFSTVLTKAVEQANLQAGVSEVNLQDFTENKKKPRQRKESASVEPVTEPVGEDVSKEEQKIFADYTIDLTELARKGELDPVIGRDAELRRVLEILGRKKKNNPVLVGEPGVGKTAVAEALALRLASDKVPESLSGRRLLSLDIAALLAGSRYRGEFEDRIKQLIKAIQNHSGQIILFIDEMHMIVGAGNPEGGVDAANILKPALARGELHVLGATTHQEFRKHIEKDAALERRFQSVQVDEPSSAIATSILRGLKQRYEIFHGVQIRDDAILSSVELSVRYLPNRRLPDKAIDVIDEAASRLRLQIDSVPAQLDQLRSRIEEIEIEKKAFDKAATRTKAYARLNVELKTAQAEHTKLQAVWQGHKSLLEELRTLEAEQEELVTLYENSKSRGDFDFAAQIQHEQMPVVESKMAKCRGKLIEMQKDHSFLCQEVGKREVASVVAAWTGVPVGKMLESEAQKLLTMEDRITERVYGQDEAVKRVCKAIRRTRVGVSDPKRPQGVFLFLGETGVGKTETAKAIAREIFDDEARIIRIDMSEYMERHNVARLIGSPPGYVGYGEGGELSDAVRLKPYSVVLFDEIEKAHPQVLDILLQVLDEGQLTDAQGRHVSFRSATIIMTSNLPVYEDGANKDDGSYEDRLRDQLQEHLRPELLNRIDELVVYRSLGLKDYQRLIDRLLGELNGRLADREFRVVLGESLRLSLARVGLSGNYGGRSVRRAFETQVVNAVTDRILLLPAAARGAWCLELDDNGAKFWEEAWEQHRYLPPAKA